MSPIWEAGTYISLASNTLELLELWEISRKTSYFYTAFSRTFGARLISFVCAEPGGREMGQRETKQWHCQKLLTSFSLPYSMLGTGRFSANIFKSSLLQAAVKEQLLTELTKHCSKAAAASSLLREKHSLPWPHTTSILLGRKIISATQGGAGGTGEGDDEKSDH